MIGVEKYISNLKEALLACFGSRLVYVGLQGSYLRGEATENSDIDIVAVVDKLAVSDLDKYRCIIQTMGDFDKSCGFICGKEDLANWNPLEIHHLVNGTKDYYGALKDLVPNYTEGDIRNFIKLSLNNMYHQICHRYIHSPHRLEADYNDVVPPFPFQNVRIPPYLLSLQSDSSVHQAHILNGIHQRH